MTSQAAAFASHRRRVSWLVLVDLLALTKPRITLSSTLAAAAGMASQGQGWLSATNLLALLGISMTVAAACTLNMWLERDTDALMNRTAERPLPAQRLEARAALGLALGLCAAGLSLTLALGNVAAALMSLAALLLYGFAYTPLKRFTPVASLVGMVPGAMPPIIGAAVLGAPQALAWALAVVLALWQVPHLMAVALRLRGQYAAARLHTLLDWLGEQRTLKTMQVGLLVLSALAFLPALAVPARGTLWIAGGVAAVIACVAAARAYAASESDLRGRWFILATVLYVVPLMLGALAAGVP